MEKIFNKQIFKTEKPFLHQVFKKEFDAFFFLNFPKQIDFDGENSHNLPCFFLNNIKQKNIFIANDSNSKNLNYCFQKISSEVREDFIKEFKSKIGDEQFLFWHSEQENWAMISDSKSEFALIGINWEIADQVKLFYEYFLISPKQAIEKLQLQEFSNDFFNIYKPKSVIEKGSEINQVWTKYIFNCHVENENDKIFYWKQFEPLYFSLNKVLKGLKGIDMYADQAFWRQYYRLNQWYTTGKKAAVGGWQAFSHKNCQKVATKFLNENKHLQLQFDGKYEEADKLIRESKNGLIGFSFFWIYANSKKQSQKGYHSDFYFKISDGGSGKKNSVNQQFEFYLKEDLIDSNKIDEFIAELLEVGFVNKVYKLRKPYIFTKYEMDQPIEIITMNNFRINYNDLELYWEIKK